MLLHSNDRDALASALTLNVETPDSASLNLAAPPQTDSENRLGFEAGVWLLSLRSFFEPRNHPFPDSSPIEKLKHDWSDELRVACAVIRDISSMTARLSAEKNGQESLLFAESLAEDSEPTDVVGEKENGESNNSLFVLREALYSANALCKSLLEARPVRLQSWEVVGRAIVHQLFAAKEAAAMAREAIRSADATLQSALTDLARQRVHTANLRVDVLHIFVSLARMLEWLRFIQKLLDRDQPLKQTLLVFTLVHEEARRLVAFIETRALHNEGAAEEAIETFDATGYAIKMELRKVFAHELLNLALQRQAPQVKVKVETAHGLLRNSFQQSTVALSQLYDSTLDGARLFGSYQTLLEQSLVLRSDLWKLLQMVLRAERERDVQPITPLMQELTTFSEGSLRFLMYKDWESCERFIEEVAAARGAVELAPVLHRFGTYLRTLHGQVSMRAVLANHPFEPAQVEA
ncbi:MAG: hypothetical protein AUG51_19450 [Acidobacteria bacterium 13_1_20CM_3_53_8]|nr:MAG: hypothetical protein AUG51_19450 [Acidobacteria bacterium 13_1_20CM_3_53_8]